MNCTNTLSLQSEILDKVGTDALKLGLLMGIEDDPREEEQREVLSFHHLLIMEFCAGKYISTWREVSFCRQLLSPHSTVVIPKQIQGILQD